MWWRWGRVELPVQSPSAATTTSVSDRFRQPSGRGSALSRLVQSRASRSSLLPDYATLIRAASPLNDASTTHGTEVASTLTLPPKRRGRESTACWQLLRFAACLTRPDGTSARVHCQPNPVETAHPHRFERSPASGRKSSRGCAIGQQGLSMLSESVRANRAGERPASGGTGGLVARAVPGVNWTVERSRPTRRAGHASPWNGWRSN